MILLLSILAVLMFLIIAYHLFLLRRPIYSSPDKRDAVFLITALKWAYQALAVSSGLVILTIPIAFLIWITARIETFPPLWLKVSTSPLGGR